MLGTLATINTQRSSPTLENSETNESALIAACRDREISNHLANLLNDDEKNLGSSTQ